jgi:pyruvate dehydrogenase E2 component (dihydrolipoamide acetyltransferase)
MATKVFMEALSPTMEEGRLVKWLKNEGDAVKSGEALAEVETDKAIMELVARGDGVLRKRLINEGDTAPVGTLAGVIATADENIDALVAGAAAPAAGAPAPEKVVATQQETAGVSSVPRKAEESQGEASTPPQQKVADVPPAPPGGAPRAPSAPAGNVAAPGDVRSSPLARRLASERGLDLHAVQGSGPNGRIIKRDIEAAAAAGAAAPRAAAAPVIPREGDFHDEPLTQIRKTIARRLGMAVATDDGLIVPVIWDADRKRMSDISREAKELAKRARERKLKPEEFTGSTFSVSNLGMFGIDQFTAIINPPETGILAIGTSEEKLVVIDGEPVVRSRVRVTMSCDHRVIDGAVGAKFLQTLRRLIENPLMLVY